MRIGIIEPYLGGSHLAWAEGYQQASGNEVVMIAHEARFWRWRLLGGFVTLAQQARAEIERAGAFDVIVASSLLDVAGFLGLLGPARAGAPVVLYMHENQLTYPLSPRTPGSAGSDRDLAPAMVNWTSMVAADLVAFNSRFHLDSWFAALPGLLDRFPDHRHTSLVEGVRTRSEVLTIGVDLDRIDRCRPRADSNRPGHRPRLIWNHRWDHDKGPDLMADAVTELADRGVDFELAVTGQEVPSSAASLQDLGRRLGDRLVHAGHASDTDYVELLLTADVALSTARQEFFGISVTEAAYAGALPLVPDRLVYPERIPRDLHADCLYADADLVDRLAAVLADPDRARERAAALRPVMAAHDWSSVGAAYDDRFARLVRG